MFDNLTKEIIMYPVIPTIIILLTDLVLFIVKKKKSDKIKFLLDYIINVLLMIAIALALSLVCGYTVWLVMIFWAREIFFNNFAYIAFSCFLSLCLLVLIIWAYLKLWRLAGCDDIRKEEY